MNNKVVFHKMLEDKNEYYKVKQHFVATIKSQSIIAFSLNIPGLPKRDQGFDEFQESSLDVITKTLTARPIYCLRNTAGIYYFLVCSHDSYTAKQICIQIEGSHPAFRLVDLDCFNSHGIPISRAELNYPERGCLLCSRPSSDCIINNRHNLIDLRHKAESLIMNLP